MKLKGKVLSLLLSAALVVTSVVAPMPREVQAATSQFTNFITVDGTKLMDGSKELKFVSLNYPQATSDNAWEHANAMKTIRDMGGNVTRTYTIPVWNGENKDTAYVTGVGADGKLTFNEHALDKLDDVLAKANEYGIRVIVPLVDHWHWIGGMDGYVWLAGESGGNKPTQSGFQSWAWKFYTSEKCKDYFKQMISHLLERENTVTHVKYKDDKAVLCWETCNEAGNRQQYGDTTVFGGLESDGVLTAWTNEVVDHIKSIDTNHLVLDGRMSMSPMSLSEDNHADILGAHYYEGNYAERCKDDTIAAHNAGKPFILGEFGAKITAQPCIDVFEQGRLNDTNGIMMWSLRAHKDGFGYYFHNEDGYWASYHWPGYESGNYYGETEIIRSIYAYAQIANGKASTYEDAAKIAIPAPEKDEAPLLYAAGSENEHDKSFLDGSVGDIKWRGVVGGAWYEIQRADGTVTDQASEAWKTIADKDAYVYDSGRNWEDKAHDCIAGYHDETAVDGQTYSYRLRACNESGVGLWSNIVTVEKVKHVVVDELDLIAVASNDPNPTEIRRTYSTDHSANIEYSSSSIVNKSNTEGYIEYSAKIPVDAISVKAISETEEGAEPKILVSADGLSYTELEVAHEPETNVYSVSDVLSEDKYYYSRIYLAGQSQCKLDSITITYVNDGASDRVDGDGAEVTSNVMIQDNTFGSNGVAPYYVMKSANLAINTVDTVKGLTTTDEKSGKIIYKTADDINAYRVVVNSKDEKATVEYSYDGVTFDKVSTISETANDEFTRTVYGDLNVSDTVRVIRVTLPEGSKDKVLVEAVELSSGKKSIPLADRSPFNTLEDGEYYFGDDSQIAEAYTVTKSGSDIVYEKSVGDLDYKAYDTLYAWVKPDGKSNKLSVRLTDKSGAACTSGSISLADTKAGMNKLSFEEFTNIENVNLAHISKVAFVISKNGGAEIDKAEKSIALNGQNSYTGNYGVALTYSVAGSDSTVYIDSVYASSATKVDDFEGYSGSNTLLNQAYSRNSNGGSFDLSLDSINKSEGTYGLKVDYDYKGTGYSGATKQMDLLNLAGYDGFTMFINSDGSNNEIKVQMETETSTYAYTGYMTGKGPMTLYMPFSKIIQPDWATSGTPAPIDSTQNLKSVSIYTNQNKNGSVTKGTFYVDDLKGANFVEDLASETAVTIKKVDAEITEFPYTISGTAEYVDYVSVTVGDKVFNVPVDAEGKWSYTLVKESGVYNGEEIAVKAGFYYPDGEKVSETEEATVKINIPENDAPIVESYENAIWTWDFGKDGTEGWTFDGFTPGVESDSSTGKKVIVAWSQAGYNATFSYTLTDIPNGVYTLQNDIKVKSNMNNAQMVLTDGTTEAKSTPIDTADQLEEGKFLGKKFIVTNNTITVKYLAEAPTDANGATFAVGNIKLYFVEGTDVIKNGDFASTDKAEGGAWPYYPVDWDVTPSKEAGAGKVKVDPAWTTEANAVMVVDVTDFSISQEVEISAADAGVYEFSVKSDATNGGQVAGGAPLENYVMEITNADREVVAKKEIGNGNDVYKISDVTLAAGTYTVKISGKMAEKVENGSLYIHSVALKLITPNVPEDSEPAENYIINGDFTEVEGEWPNLPIGWDASYTGGDGWSPIKGEDGKFVGYADNAYTFELKQAVKSIPDGTYKLTAEMELLNADTANAVVVDVNGTNVDVTEDLVAGSVVTVQLDGIQVVDGKALVTISGDFKNKGIKVDNVALNFVSPRNYVVNGDFTSVDAEWPNLPTDWDASYTGGDGWSPIKGEDGKFVGYADNAYTFELEQSINDIPDGTYSLSAELELLNADTANEVVVDVNGTNKDVTEELVADSVSSVQIDDIQVVGGKALVKFTGDFKNKGIKIDNVVMLFVSPRNYVANGDFSEVETEWPNLPTGWESSYTGGDGWSPIKGEDGKFVGYADNAYTFDLMQNVTDIPNGVYELTAELELLNADTANSVVVDVNGTSKDVTEELEAGSVLSVKIDNIKVVDGKALVKFTGDFKNKGVKIDNVKLIKTGDIESGNSGNSGGSGDSGNSGGLGDSGDSDSTGTTTTEEATTTEKNEAGKDVTVTTTVEKENGVVTKVTEVSVIENPAANTSVVVTVVKDGNEKILEVEATVEKTIASGNKLSIQGTVTSQIVEAAGTKDVMVTFVAKDAKDKTKFKVRAKASNLVSGNKLKIYQYNTKTGEYVMVNAKDYAVNSNGTVSVSMSKKATFELVSQKEAKSIDKKIAATVKLKKSSATVKKGKKTVVTMSKNFNENNAKKVTYSSADKKVATVDSKGNIKAKKKGTVKIKAKVTLKNGTTKTLTLKVKVK